MIAAAEKLGQSHCDDYMPDILQQNYASAGETYRNISYGMADKKPRACALNYSTNVLHAETHPAGPQISRSLPYASIYSRDDVVPVSDLNNSMLGRARLANPLNMSQPDSIQWGQSDIVEFVHHQRAVHTIRGH